jgi:hypothetical protein
MNYLTYEAFLDEVTTLLTEMYELDDNAAIKLVVDAQANDYFSPHDDHEEMRTLERAREDAKALYKAKQDRNQTQDRQQRRVAQRAKPQR